MTLPYYKLFKRITTLSLVVLALNCKSAKRVSATGEAGTKLSAKEIIKKHQKNDAVFKTLQAKVKIDIVQNEKEQGLTFSFRMEKDKAIWLSAPLGLARMLITPSKVQYYNKLENEYFDGDYKLLSDVVGVELDFNKVQNILLGQAIYSLNTPHNVSVSENTYALSPKKQNALMELFYLINPTHFKMQSLQLQQQKEKRFLQVDYTAYQNVNEHILPKGINIVAVEDNKQVSVTMDIKQVSVDEPVRFPFKIPSGYKEIVIK